MRPAYDAEMGDTLELVRIVIISGVAHLGGPELFGQGTRAMSGHPSSSSPRARIEADPGSRARQEDKPVIVYNTDIP